MWIHFFHGSCRTIRFPQVTMCLCTGMIGGDKINCHEAIEVAVASIKNVVVSDFGHDIFKRCSRVTPIKSFTSAVKILDEEVSIDPRTIFRQISFHKKPEVELRKFF